MSFLKNIAVCYFCNGSLFEHEVPLYVESRSGSVYIRQVNIIIPVFITVSACSSNVSDFKWWVFTLAKILQIAVFIH